MNFIYLKGIIKNITYSHTIGDTIFNKADLIVRRPDGREDLVVIKFKEFSFTGSEYREVELIGNIRSFSHQVDGKNKVEVYVFSYFDEVGEQFEQSNVVLLEGKICKKDTIRKTSSGKHYIHYIVANNIHTENGTKLSSYIPCVSWGKTAREIENNFNVGDTVHIEGQLQSREHKKRISDNEVELRLAHELATTTINKV
jgi:primosomal replication protein N